MVIRYEPGKHWWEAGTRYAQPAHIRVASVSSKHTSNQAHSQQPPGYLQACGLIPVQHQRRSLRIGHASQRLLPLQQRQAQQQGCPRLRPQAVQRRRLQRVRRQCRLAAAAAATPEPRWAMRHGMWVLGAATAAAASRRAKHSGKCALRLAPLPLLVPLLPSLYKCCCSCFQRCHLLQQPAGRVAGSSRSSLRSALGQSSGCPLRQQHCGGGPAPTQHRQAPAYVRLQGLLLLGGSCEVLLQRRHLLLAVLQV